VEAALKKIKPCKENGENNIVIAMITVFGETETKNHVYYL